MCLRFWLRVSRVESGNGLEWTVVVVGLGYREPGVSLMEGELQVQSRLQQGWGGEKGPSCASGGD